MCTVFVCFLSFSLSSGLSHQDYSSIHLSLPNTIEKGCVLSFPLAFSIPTKPTAPLPFPVPPTSEAQKAPSPPRWLSPLPPPPLFTRQLLGRLVFSSPCSLLFLLLPFTLYPFLSSTLSSTMSAETVASTPSLTLNFFF